MKYFIPYLLLLLIVSCKEKLNYNPFDEQFNVSVNSLINDGVDTVMAGCGYYNLAQKKMPFQVYYQMFADEKDVVAKGFGYFIDTININSNNEFGIEFKLVDSIIALPFKINKFDAYLSQFNYIVLDRDSSNVIIVNEILNDTISLEIGIDFPQHKLVRRYLSYFKGPKNENIQN